MKGDKVDRLIEAGEKMLEVEMKFRVENATEFEKRLKNDFQIEFGEPIRETDVFFKNKALGFPKAGKTLRVRRSGNLLAATFKGPRLDATTKTREEIELPLFPAFETVENDAQIAETRAEWIRFFKRLGFEPCAKVEKIRRRGRLTFAGREFEITLDEAPPLGFFTEIETLAEPDELDAARTATLALAQRLRLGETVVKSYLALLEKSTDEEK